MKLIFKTKNQDTIDGINEFIHKWNDDSLTISTKTSGSTGKPKNISISKEHMIASAKMTGRFLELEKNKNALMCLPISSIGGKMMVVRAIVLDLDLIVVQPSKNPLENLLEKIHFAAMTPMQVEGCLETSKSEIENIETLIIGGGIISPALEKKIIDLPLSIFQTFGMTETISHVAMRNVTEREMMYEALPDIHFSIQDALLVIHASHLGIERLQTNDIVKLIGDTKFIWFGRNDHVINSGGIKIHPAEIEKKLSVVIPYKFFSTSLKDDKLGEKHVLFIESKEINQFNKNDFSKFINRYEIPKEIYYIEEFSCTHSGKIDPIETKKRKSDAQKQVL